MRGAYRNGCYRTDHHVSSFRYGSLFYFILFFAGVVCFFFCLCVGHGMILYGEMVYSLPNGASRVCATVCLFECDWCCCLLTRGKRARFMICRGVFLVVLVATAHFTDVFLSAWDLHVRAHARGMGMHVRVN